MSIKATLKKDDRTVSEFDRTVWILEIKEVSREGLTCLKDIFRKLGPHGRKFLKRRIKTSDPEVKKMLKDLGP